MCAAKTKLILSLITYLIGANKLSLNVSQTKFASFHTKQKRIVYPDLKINTISRDRVSEFNFPGLIISSDLKWSKHIDHIDLKISKVICPTLPEDILLTIYNSLMMLYTFFLIVIFLCTIHTHNLLINVNISVLKKSTVKLP